ncbi:MAG: response regulator transcription factor [Candidatus Taylorbacteria bacterium]|nr:response regulator transcription factor [Candidatus Taylorbacteria bacterium]
MKILLIEDDIEFLDKLSRKLTSSGYIVDISQDGKSGSYTARTNHYDVIIIDNNIPGKKGIEICQEIRMAKIQTPILMLTIDNVTEVKVKALDAGADDYLTKPFSYIELIARIKSLTRRSYPITEQIYKLDDLTINCKTEEVIVDGKGIYFTRKEFLLLSCIAKNAGKVVSRGQILEEAWGNDVNPFSNTIEAHIRNIRKKIGESNKRRYIQTVPGRGYKLDRSR